MRGGLGPHADGSLRPLRGKRWWWMTKRYNPNEDRGATVPLWLSRRPDISMGAKVAYSRLLQYSDAEGVAKPSAAELARELGVSRRMTVTYLKELFGHGVLAREARPGRATCYRFLSHKWQTEGAAARKVGNNDSQVERN